MKHEIIKHLEDLSLFELWRLQCVISQLLEDPNKINLIKMALRTGMGISYFDGRENREIQATVIEIRKTKVLVLNKDDGKYWNLPFYMLNLTNVNTNISTPPTQRKFSKINFKVGDNVGWVSTKLHQELFGKIIKLNPKYAKISLPDGRLWNVTYSLLFPIVEGELHKTSGVLIEGEVIR